MDPQAREILMRKLKLAQEFELIAAGARRFRLIGCLGRSGATRSSALKVWNLTASAPASIATSTSFMARSSRPL
jgi:hypothetical protein